MPTLRRRAWPAGGPSRPASRPGRRPGPGSSPPPRGAAGRGTGRPPAPPRRRRRPPRAPARRSRLSSSFRGPASSSIRVRTPWGQIAWTTIPRCPYVARSHSAKATAPCFDTEYGALPSMVSRPAADAVTTNRPSRPRTRPASPWLHSVLLEPAGDEEPGRADVRHDVHLEGSGPRGLRGVETPADVGAGVREVDVDPAQLGERLLDEDRPPRPPRRSRPTTATAPSSVATSSTAGSRSASTSRNPSAASRCAIARPMPTGGAGHDGRGARRIHLRRRPSW